jgi:hypothetical protein
MGDNIRSATSILTELRDGHVITELSGAIHDALAAVKEHNKAAEVILHIRIAPFSKTQLVEPAITMTAEVEKKLPKEVPPSTIFFLSEDGNPQRNPERQQSMTFGVASTPDRTVSGA